MKYTFANPFHLIALAVGIGAIAGLHTQDDAIENKFQPDRPLGTTFDKIMSIGANPFVLGGATLAALGISELAGYKKGAATAGTLLEAVGLTEVMTIGLQLATHRTRPDGSLNSLPSGHTSGAFALAAATEVLYGPWFGVPSFMLASLVGVSRIDANRHWATDVMGGALLGTLVGIGTAEFHKKELSNFFLIPTVDEKSAGISMLHIF